MTTLTRAGRRVIALDNRGHGASTKLYDPADYHSAIMAEDVRALLDHLGLPRADVMGYSMGARITAFLALSHPDRVRSAVLGGLGIRLVEGVGLPDTIADALEAPSLAEVSDPTAYHVSRFRRADQIRPAGACRLPARLAPDAQPRRGRAHRGAGPGRGRHRRTRSPARPKQLAALIPGAQALAIPGPRPHVGGRRQGL